MGLTEDEMQDVTATWDLVSGGDARGFVGPRGDIIAVEAAPWKLSRGYTLRLGDRVCFRVDPDRIGYIIVFETRMSAGRHECFARLDEGVVSTGGGYAICDLRPFPDLHNPEHLERWLAE